MWMAPARSSKPSVDADVREGGMRRGAYVDGGAGAGGQLLVAGDKVGMQMGLEDVADLDVLLARRIEVNLDIALGIDHDRLALRGKHVGGMGQTAQIELLKVHEFSRGA